MWERRTSKEIAVELGISAATVDGYIKEAMEQLGARNRREAAAIAFGSAPITPPIKRGTNLRGWWPRTPRR